MHWSKSNKELSHWGTNMKCFQVPLFKKYLNVPSSLLDNILGRFVFNTTFIIACVQSTCKMPSSSNSRVYRRLKSSSRKQNSKNVHAKITDNCFEAISALKLVIGTIGFVSRNRFHQSVWNACFCSGTQKY